MKRIELNSPSTLEGLKLVERDRPSPGPDDLLVRVAATSLNFHDYLVAKGMMPAAAGRVPMSDGVGTVAGVGANVKGYREGDRVLGTFFPNWFDGPPTPEKIAAMGGDHVDGFAAEYVCMPARTFTRVPKHLSDVEAATLPCAGLTAWRALMVEGKIMAGDSVLVQGTGGVSLFALQLAKMAGASVVALSSTKDKLDRLKKLGADHVINYKENPEYGKLVKEATGGRGVDHVVEVVGGDMSQSMASRRVGGSTYLIGALSRKPISFSAMFMIGGNARLIGLTVGSRAEQEDMVRAIELSGIKPVVDKVFKLEQLADAFRYQESGAQFGKICVTC